MRIGLKSAAIAVALVLNPLTAGAAGLGKISVLSTLGQPLKAEVDISASRDEVPTLAARLAPADAFKQQGIAYGAALSGIRVAIEKRPSGQPYIRITGDRPLNEPFLELLVELSWGSGRLVREYTFLLDPPVDVTQKAVTTPVAPPEVKAEAKAEAKAEPKVEAQPEPKAAVAEPEKKPAPPTAVAAEARPEPKKAAEAGEREVKRGDTLGKIAAELKPEGVNLDQMLVALFRSNKDAFDGENMNRLRAGKILKTPEREDILALDAADARQVVVAQSADFSAYRKKLAGAVAAAPAKEEAPKQAVAGKITPKVEDKAPAAPVGKDKLEVSRTEAAKDAKGAAAAKARISALEEDLVARDRALKEANSRVAELEKNLGDLKKLAQLKSEAGAKVQEQAAKPAVPEAKKPEPAPVKPTEAPKVAAPPPAAAPTVPAAAPAAVAKPEEAKPAEAAKPAKPPAPVKKPAPPPPPEPTFMEEYGGMLAMAGAALVTALLGFLGFTAIRKKRRAKAEAAAEGSALTGTDLAANSVFGATGGQSVDTGAAMHTDFGQAAGGHDEGVDPVAEADVYMAYGRDAQAEEILIEALKTEPSRHTIHVKLLEIYSARKSARQFETLAMDLKGQTGGSGADWEKAASMGRALDPSNPLYAPAGAAEIAPVAPVTAPAAPAAAPSPSLASTVIFAPGASEKMQATVTMPGQLAQMAAAAEAQAPQEAASLDFDLDLGGPVTEQPGAAAGVVEEPAAPASMDFDLDLGGPAGAAPAAAAPAPAALDIDLGLGAPTEQPAADAGIDFAMDLGTAPAAPPAAASAAAAEPSAGGIDFDFGAGEPAAEAAAPTAAPSPAMDLSSISLDLGEPTAAAQAAAAGPDSPEVATKLELAQAYEEMGDKDGARELLQEVLKEGGANQQETARARLAKL